VRLTACKQQRNGPWLSPIICETLVAYYREVDEMIPEPVFNQETDLELHAPVGAYALCAVAVRKPFVLGLM
jgi:hypothetical protein